MITKILQQILLEEAEVCPGPLFSITNLEKVIGKAESDSLLMNGLAQKVEASVVDGQCLSLMLGDGTKNYYIETRSDGYLCDPEDGVGICLLIPYKDLEFVRFNFPNFISTLARKNGFEPFTAPGNEWGGFVPIGTRSVGRKNILWIGLPPVTSARKITPLILKEQTCKNGFDIILLSSLQPCPNRTELPTIRELRERVHPIPLPSSSSNWELDHSIYCNHLNGFRCEDLLSTMSYPLAVDEIEKHYFILGRRVNRSPDTNTFKFIRALSQIVGKSEMHADIFLDRIGITTSGKAVDCIRNLRRELKVEIESAFGDDPDACIRALELVYKQPRGGFIKANFGSKDLVYWA